MNTCEGCTACCRLLGIVELNKPEGQFCPHCPAGAAGCAIYETRPQSCRTFECAWLMFKKMGKPLPERLRPDRSRVVVNITDDTLALVCAPGYAGAWRRKEFNDLILHAQRNGLNVVVSCEGVDEAIVRKG